MSTLTVSNVSDGTTSVGTTYVTNGSAKAWINFNGTGTIAARDSLNVSSLTDNGTGDYSINFSSAMNAADYAGCYEAGVYTDNNDGSGVSTGTTVVRTFAKASPSLTDSSFISASVFGDLA